jgi:hypothetical protein
LWFAKPYRKSLPLEERPMTPGEIKFYSAATFVLGLLGIGFAIVLAWQ